MSSLDGEPRCYNYAYMRMMILRCEDQPLYSESIRET